MASFDIATPSEGDVGHIASVHLAAMDSNILLHAQFPDLEALQNLEALLASLTFSQLKDSKVGVLVARHPQSREIISFIKWELPEAGILEGGVEEFKWSDGCCQEYLDEYASKAEKVKQGAIGDLACYHITFVCTNPRWQGHGVGTAMTRQVLEEARAVGTPVYLESTLEAVKMYEKLGFRPVGGFEMMVPSRDSREAQAYEEVCMLWRPDM